MKKTVEKAIVKINNWVEKQTEKGVDITDFLYDAEENYEFNEDGEPTTCDWIINGLWNEADMFVDVWKQNKSKGF